MSELRTMTDSDLVDVATRLRNLKWSWRLADFPTLAADFGWTVLDTGGRWVRFDSGFGRTSGNVRGQDIQVAVTGFATEDEAGLDAINDAFARMTAALTAAFGEPTTRIPDAAEVRWAGPETTLRLCRGRIWTTLHLVTNEWMARSDKSDELVRQGLA